MTRLLFVMGLLVLWGCGLDRPYPDKSYYALEGAARHSGSAGATGRVIRVPRASVAPPFASRALQYRVAPNRYEPSYYHNWADDPGALVGAVAAQTIAATTAFAVVAPGSDAAAGETLELYVTALYVDVTGPQPTVVLALRATLLDEAGEVLLSRDFDRIEPTDTAEAPDAVRAFNTALQTTLGDLSTRIADVQR